MTKLATRLLIRCPVKDPGPLAQLAEQVTLNHQVAGSSPARLTSPFFSSVFTVHSPLVPPLRNNYHNHAWPADILLDTPLAGRGYHKLPTASRRPILAMVLLALSVGIAAGGAGEPSRGLAPPSLPEYVVEVVP